MHTALSDINDAGDSPSLPPGKEKSAPEINLIYIPRQYMSKCNLSARTAHLTLLNVRLRGKHLTQIGRAHV